MGWQLDGNVPSHALQSGGGEGRLGVPEGGEDDEGEADEDGDSAVDPSCLHGGRAGGQRWRSMEVNEGQ